MLAILMGEDVGDELVAEKIKRNATAVVHSCNLKSLESSENHTKNDVKIRAGEGFIGDMLTGSNPCAQG